jgi:Flp pilus assembly protein TadD
MAAKAVAEGALGTEVDKLLADLALSEGRLDEALARYELLIASEPANAAFYEGAALASWRQGTQQKAELYSKRGVLLSGATWRLWGLRAALADEARNWVAADRAYGEALKLSPGQPELLNNQGWSHLLRGDIGRAIALLESALSGVREVPRVANNLELARAALVEDLPVRRPGEQVETYSARLNDAGVIADYLGNRGRSIAAFSEAIHARPTWSRRTEQNLRIVCGEKCTSNGR